MNTQAQQPVVMFPDTITLRIGNREFEAYIDGLAGANLTRATGSISSNALAAELGVGYGRV